MTLTSLALSQEGELIHPFSLVFLPHLGCSFFFNMGVGTQIFVGIRKLVNISVANAGTTYEISSMRGLEYLTYAFWTAMAIPHLLYFRGFITWLQFEMSATIMDVLTK